MKHLESELNYLVKSFEGIGVDLEISDRKYIMNNAVKKIKDHKVDNLKEATYILYKQLETNVNMFKVYFNRDFIEKLNLAIKNKYNAEEIAKIVTAVEKDIYSVFEFIEFNLQYNLDIDKLHVNVRLTDDFYKFVDNALNTTRYTDLTKINHLWVENIGASTSKFTFNLTSKVKENIEENYISFGEFNKNMDEELHKRFAFFIKEYSAKTWGVNFHYGQGIGLIIPKHTGLVINLDYIATPIKNTNKLRVLLKKNSKMNKKDWVVEVEKYITKLNLLDEKEMEILVKILTQATNKRNGKIN